MVLSAGTWREISCAVFYIGWLAWISSACLEVASNQLPAWNQLPLTLSGSEHPSWMDPGLNGINLFAFYLVVTRGYVQPKLLDIFSWSYNLWVLPLVLFRRSNDNVDVDDGLEATKCWQRPCGCYTRAATAPQEPHTLAYTVFLLDTHCCLEVALSTIFNPAHTACSILRVVSCIVLGQCERSSQEVPPMCVFSYNPVGLRFLHFTRFSEKCMTAQAFCCVVL